MTQTTLPASNSQVLQQSGIFSTVWFQYFWKQWLGIFPITCAPITAPPAPSKGFFIYCDVADNKLKAIAHTGTITILAVP